MRGPCIIRIIVLSACSLLLQPLFGQVRITPSRTLATERSRICRPANMAESTGLIQAGSFTAQSDASPLIGVDLWKAGDCFVAVATRKLPEEVFLFDEVSHDDKTGQVEFRSLGPWPLTFSGQLAHNLSGRLRIAAPNQLARARVPNEIPVIFARTTRDPEHPTTPLTLRDLRELVDKNRVADFR